MTFRRAWGGDEWQAYAFQLVQVRHHSQNVQVVPDRVRGDAGIEFFSLNGCLYQCYAPEEIADVAKAASAMKGKAARDLVKLDTYRAKLKEILRGIRANRWILLCPFLDDKDVVIFVRRRGIELRSLRLEFLSDDFEALVQSQDDFLSELTQLRHLSAGPPLSYARPSEKEVQEKSEGEITVRLDSKLGRAYPSFY